MTLREIIKEIGPGYVPMQESIGYIHWQISDGRKLLILMSDSEELDKKIERIIFAPEKTAPRNK